MQDSNTPVKIPLPFAAAAGGAYINAIPLLSQIGIPGQDGRASFTDGFPPKTFTPLATGGKGPFGSDANGLLHQVTNGLQWLQAGGPLFYDATFSSQISGYPRGALIQATGTLGLFWMSIVDNNMTDPDTGGSGWIALLIRTTATAGVDYYLSPGGSDSVGDGSAISPWRQPQHAWDFLSTVDLNKQAVTVHVADGGYNPLHASGQLLGQADVGSVLFQGNTVTPNNVTIIATNDSSIVAEAGANFTVRGFHFAATGTGVSQGFGITCGRGSNVSFNNIDFGACATAHVNANEGSTATATAGYSISGASPYHLYSDALGIIQTFAGITVTLTGTPAFATAYAAVSRNALIIANGCTFSGSATGTKCIVGTGGGIDTEVGATPALAYFPGSVNGTAPTSGWIE